MRCRVCIIVLLAAATAVEARAGIFFNRKPRNSAPSGVDALIQSLRGDPNETTRAEAAENLRNFDTTSYPQLVPALAQSATSDPSAAVRIEAIKTLGKLRPINERAGMALEQASQDSNLRVQWHARTTLLQYRMSGYKHGSGDLPGERPIRTDEPPLAQPPPSGATTFGPSTVPAPLPQRVRPNATPLPVYPTGQPGNIIYDNYPGAEPQSAPPTRVQIAPQNYPEPPPPPMPPAAPVEEGPSLTAPK